MKGKIGAWRKILWWKRPFQTPLQRLSQGPKLMIHLEAARESEGNALFQRSSRRLKHRVKAHKIEIRPAECLWRNSSSRVFKFILSFHQCNLCICAGLCCIFLLSLLSVNPYIVHITPIAMENLRIPCSSSSAASCSSSVYDVFINHRGPDCKNTFAISLYRRLHGLRVFLDQEVLVEGLSITSQIKDAICGAFVHVAIFSPTYADSPWCLDELVHMVDSGATILPVFYRVQPSVVRWNMSGAYGEALQRLQEKKTLNNETGREDKPRYDSVKIKSWRDALSLVADKSGFVLQGDEYYELLDKLVQRIYENIPKPTLDVARYPTGLDLKLQEFEMLVPSNQQDESKRSEAKVLGIWGVGGVGKTTLAKGFFNCKSSSYKASSFLFDVREHAARGSLSHVQSKLIKDLVKTDIKIENTAEGKGLFKRHLSHCHALVVIDDVDNRDQLAVLLPIKDILSPQSLIVVTSRDKHVLKSSGMLESSIYNLEGLNTLHSKQLFCSYAFCSSVPPPEFVYLVDQFVEACGGLPLSLEVVGALVCGNDKGYWEGQLDRLRETPPADVLKRLRISYDSLEERDQSTFLDIACGFIGEDRDTAINIWDTVGLRNLEDKCLLQVENKNEINEIKMHDHLRDLGRKIAQEESSPRRLWHYTNDIDDWLEQLEQSSAITEVRGLKTINRGLKTINRGHSRWDDRMISKMSPNKQKRGLGRGAILNMNLQFVAAEDGYLERILERMRPPNLKWLRWYKCPYFCLPQWIPMENLKVLEVAGAKLKDLWSRHHCQVPVNLRELHIFAPLSRFPESIGQLKHLSKIVLFNPELEGIPLETLPEEFCDLRSLKYLQLEDCHRLQLLPDSFGKLASLEHIDFHGASSLRALPDSFGQLSRLKYLNLGRCSNLTIFNGTLRNITTLKFLNLRDCNQRLLGELYLKRMDLEELPGGMLHHCNLKLVLGTNVYWKSLNQCILEELPPQIGDIKNLNDLSVTSSSKLTRLPNSFVSLTRLTRLYLVKCGIEYLPQDFALMKSLETLRVIRCPLQELPFKKVEGETGSSTDHKCCMFGLKKLELRNTAVSEVSFPMGVCPNLEKLSFSECENLRQIGELCGLVKLQSFHIDRCPVTELPSFETLISLERLKIESCHVESIEGLEHVMSLKSVTVRQCPKLKWGRGVAEQLQQRLHKNFIEIQDEITEAFKEIQDEITEAF